MPGNKYKSENLAVNVRTTSYLIRYYKPKFCLENIEKSVLILSKMLRLRYKDERVEVFPELVSEIPVFLYMAP
jgi:hypothetical protein